MISDKNLIKLSAAVSVIGIAMLFVAVQLAEPQAVRIVDINDAMLGKIVGVNGTIDSINTNNGNVFIKLYDGTGRIDVVVFERNARNNKDVYNVKEGWNITVTGKVAVYKAGLEIIAESVTLVKTI